MATVIWMEHTWALEKTSAGDIIFTTEAIREEIVDRMVIVLTTNPSAGGKNNKIFGADYHKYRKQQKNRDNSSEAASKTNAKEGDALVFTKHNLKKHAGVGDGCTLVL